MSKTLTDWVRGTARAENVKFYPRNFDIWAKSHFLPDFDKKNLIWPKVFFATTIFVNWAYHQYTRGCHFRLGFNPEKLCVSEVLVVFWCSPRILAIFWELHDRRATALNFGPRTMKLAPDSHFPEKLMMNEDFWVPPKIDGEMTICFCFRVTAI